MIREVVLVRARWACQACGARAELEVHHVRKRSQGGSDFDLDTLVALCHTCHAQTDAPYATGRLVVTPLGLGRFGCDVIQRRSKWDAPEPMLREDQSLFKTEAVLPTWANQEPFSDGLGLDARHGSA